MIVDFGDSFSSVVVFERVTGFDPDCVRRCSFFMVRWESPVPIVRSDDDDDVGFALKRALFTREHFYVGWQHSQAWRNTTPFPPPSLLTLVSIPRAGTPTLISQ